MLSPGVEAKQDAYWKLGVYNPWNRRCEASLIDDDGKKETCGVIFTEDPPATGRWNIWNTKKGW